MNLTGADLLTELQEKDRKLTLAINSLAKNGIAYAKAKAKYEVAYAKKITELETNGTKMTIIRDLAKGDKEIARLKVEKISAEVTYDSNQEFINFIKLELKILQDLVDIEYGRRD